MICDHVAGISFFSPITGANRFVASAAEAFVFLAGLVMGMVYGRRIQRDGWLVGAEAVLKRAVVLYGATVGLTLLFAGLFRFTDLKLWVDREYGLGLTDPVELVVGTLTLHYTYHGTDILWMYTVLIIATPIVLLLLQTGRTRSVLLGSWALWLAHQVFPSQAVVPWVATNVNYFPVAAWQLIFVHGLVLGYHRTEIRARLKAVGVPAWQLLLLFSAGLALLVAMHRAHDLGRLASWPVLGRLAGDLYQDVFDKPTLAAGRLLAFAIVAGFGYTLVTVAWRPMRRAFGWFLMPLGTSALRAYALHLIFIVVVYNVDALARLYDRSRLANTALQIVTLGLVWVTVVGWKRFELGVDWRSVMPHWTLRTVLRPGVAGALSAAGLVIAVVAYELVGPVQVERPVSMDAIPADARTLRYVPVDDANPRPLPILLVLADDGESGPEAARPLTDVALRNRWALIAPTVPYGDWENAEEVAGDAAENLPKLLDLVDGLDEHAGAVTREEIMLLGFGRGAHTARQFALFYPERVRAVATVGPAPCTLPALSAGSRGEPLPFPFGLGDIDMYAGEDFDPAALARVRLWLGINLATPGAAAQCPWGELATVAPPDRAAIYARRVRDLGADVSIAISAEPGAAELQSKAIAFLQSVAAEGR
jgi:pimeloyl-ACP methyl ester carboxylesterase